MKSFVIGELKVTEFGGHWSYEGTDGLMTSMTDAVLNVGINSPQTVDVTTIVREHSEDESKFIAKVDENGDVLKETKTYNVTKFMIEFESED
jgi:hypothetical protein